MLRYLLALVLLSTAACSGGGHSSDQKETGGVSVSLQWPPSISGAVHTSAFGLPSGVTQLNFSIEFLGDDFDPQSHTVLVARNLGIEETTVDGSPLLAPEPDGRRVTFDVPAGLNRGIFIEGTAEVEGQDPVDFAGFKQPFDVDSIDGASVTVTLTDDADRPQPTFEILGADNPVVGGSLLLSAQGRIGTDFTFPASITNVTSSDPLVAEVDLLDPTAVSLLAVGSVTLRVDLASGDQVILPLDVTLEAQVVDMSGSWKVIESVALGSELCPRALLDPMAVTQDGNGITVELSNLETLTGQISGLEFSWNQQSYPQDLDSIVGTTTESVTGTLSLVAGDGVSPGFFDAERSWSWSEGDPLTDCTGTSTLQGYPTTQPPTFEILGADNPVAGGSLDLSAQGRIGTDFTFPVAITNVTSSDLAVAEVDLLDPTMVNLLAAGPVTLTVDLASGDQVLVPLDVALEAPAVNMSGSWTVIETVALGSELCPRASLDPMTVAQDDANGISVDIVLSDLTTATLTGQITGLNFFWTDQTYLQDLGTTTESLTGIVTDVGLGSLTFNGSRSWSWTDGIDPLNDCTGMSTVDGANIVPL